MLHDNKNLALVSDAGTPGINDPGGLLIQEILKEIPDAKIVPIPGPNAAIAALSICGFPSDKFVYMGFVPHKKGRRKFFEHIVDTKETVVFYESKYRIIKTLHELEKVLKKRCVVVARELTKQFETVYRGDLLHIVMQLERGETRGEFVIVVSGKEYYEGKNIRTTREKITGR